jgi:hypothetical protein
VQILTDNNRQERKTSSHTAEEINTLRSKKECRYYRGYGEEFTDTTSATKEKKWESAENDKQKSQ